MAALAVGNHRLQRSHVPEALDSASLFGECLGPHLLELFEVGLGHRYGNPKGKQVIPGAHAMGDRAIRDTLDAYQAIRQAGLKNIRLSIGHSTMIHPDDKPRYQQYDVTANTFV